MTGGDGMNSAQAIETARPLSSHHHQKGYSTKKKIVITLFVSVLMIILTISFLYPFFYMIINAMKTSMDYYKHPFSLPRQWTWENFKAIVVDYNIMRNVANTMLIAVVSTILVIVTSIFAAYAFSKLRFTGKALLYTFILSTMFLPMQVTMIPRYVMFSKLGLIDTYWAVILSYWAGGLPGTILLLTGTFTAVPRDLIECAKLDGAGFMQIIWRLVVPISMPGIAITIIFQFISCWNDYLTPLLYISSQERQTVTVILSQLMNKYSSNPTRQFAGLFISVMPTIVLYLFLQKQMVKGVTVGAVK